MGGVEMPIYYAAISRYAEDNGFTGEARDRLLRFVSTIDAEYLQAQRSAEKPKDKTTEVNEHA